MATSRRTYEQDTPLFLQEWTRAPNRGTWFEKIEDDLDSLLEQTITFPVECNFDLNPHGLLDVQTMTDLNFTVTHVALNFTASWVSLEAQLRKKSTDDLIATTGPQIMSADGLWHYDDPFNAMPTLSLDSSEADDLRIKMIADSSNRIVAGAYIAVDHLGGHNGTFGPMMVYDVVPDIIKTSINVGTFIISENPLAVETMNDVSSDVISHGTISEETVNDVENVVVSKGTLSEGLVEQ